MSQFVLSVNRYPVIPAVKRTLRPYERVGEPKDNLPFQTHVYFPYVVPRTHSPQILADVEFFLTFTSREKP